MSSLSDDAANKKREYERQYYAKNRERRLEQAKQYREADPEKYRAIAKRSTAKRQLDDKRKLEHQKWMQKYYLENRERIAERDNTESARERRKAARSAWRLENQETIRRSNRARRARLKGTATESYTEEDVLSRWGTDCWICLGPIDLAAPRKSGVEGWELGLHLDHVILIASGGSDTLDNVKPAHGMCNLKRPKK